MPSPSAPAPRRGTRPFVAAAFAALLCLCAAPTAARAQDAPAVVVSESALQEVRLRDGTVLRGYVVAADARTLTFTTVGGEQLVVPRQDVASVRSLDPGARESFADPMRHRLFVGPTARTLPAGEGYVGLVDAFFPTAAYGVTDRVGVEAGTVLVPEAVLEAFFVAGKVELVRTPALSVAGGAIALFATDELDEGSVGALYGVGTAGSDDASVSLAALWPFAQGGGDGWISDDPFLMLGGDLRLSPGMRLISENYLIPGTDASAVSAGFRFLGRSISADVGAGGAFEDGGFVCCLPLITVVYAFGGGR